MGGAVTPVAHDHAHDEHAHDHAHAHEEEDRRIRVLHGASPYCWWSWGYEGVMNRLKLLYGDQIKVNTYQIPVYQDLDEHNRNYGTGDPEVLREWAAEASQAMGLPLRMEALDTQPRNCLPGTLAVHAAELARPGAGERMARVIGYHMNVAGGLDLEGDESLYALAERCGAPRKLVEQVLDDGRAEAALKQDMEAYHMLGLNFYALQARDAEGRTVTIEHAFDSARMEEALEWLSRGKLRKQALPGLAEYAVAHAPVSARELREVFRLDEGKVRKALEPAERARKLVRREHDGHAFWLPP